MQHLNLMEPSIFEKEYKNLVKHQVNIWNLPKIKAYISSDKWFERPVNDLQGRWLWFIRKINEILKYKYWNSGNLGTKTVATSQAAHQGPRPLDP